MQTRQRAPRHAPTLARAIGALGAAAALALATGCAAVGFIGAMADSAERTGSSTIEAEYDGLAGGSYAVVVWADRSVQMQFPALVPSLIQRVDQRLAANAGATGHVPGDRVTEYLSNHPQWVAWPRSRLAAELDNVDRLVFIEVNEFRTNEPGNDFIWDGLAWATVSVVERAQVGSDAEVFRREIRVRFPDSRGFGVDDFGRDAVASTLLKRLVDRASWLFYTHEEPNAITY
jgi:hypothetical protein